MDMPDYTPLYLLDNAYAAIEMYANTSEEHYMEGAEQLIQLAILMVIEGSPDA